MLILHYPLTASTSPLALILVSSFMIVIHKMHLCACSVCEVSYKHTASIPCIIIVSRIHYTVFSQPWCICSYIIIIYCPFPNHVFVNDRMCSINAKQLHASMRATCTTRVALCKYIILEILHVCTVHSYTSYTIVK